MTREDKNTKKIEKIVINAGIGRISSQPNFVDKILPELIKDFSLMVGQKPSTQGAKKSISGFKLREGMIVGLKATLRGRRMIDFLEKIIKIVLPRIRDFRGIDPKNIDSHGNLTIGIKENLVFPEINPEISKVSFGVQVTIVPQSVKNRNAAIETYRSLGLPLKRK